MPKTLLKQDQTIQTVHLFFFAASTFCAKNCSDRYEKRKTLNIKKYYLKAHLYSAAGAFFQKTHQHVKNMKIS